MWSVLIRTGARSLAAFALAMLPACSTYQIAATSLSQVGDVFTPPAPSTPKIDLSAAKWQKLSPAQPDANPLRVAIVARDAEIGATRVVVKAPPSFALPAYWLNAQGTYTVLKGTFEFETVGADGQPQKLIQAPGAFALVPPNLIQRAATKAGDEGLLYITVYGEWAPSFAEGAWAMPSLRAGS